ncbi:hypothetical protein RB195_000300 [Necator americanus]|uniref:Uncharacterized protein n=1 Tax=Necator americanus TaxID=51031 RepID=A0ABR1DBZ8_NECAM
MENGEKVEKWKKMENEMEKSKFPVVFTNYDRSEAEVSRDSILVLVDRLTPTAGEQHFTLISGQKAAGSLNPPGHTTRSRWDTVFSRRTGFLRAETDLSTSIHYFYYRINRE